eukprot:2449183-Rhodomonas_salina.7
MGYLAYIGTANRGEGMFSLLTAHTTNDTWRYPEVHWRSHRLLTWGYVKCVGTASGTWHRRTLRAVASQSTHDITVS